MYGKSNVCLVFVSFLVSVCVFLFFCVVLCCSCREGEERIGRGFGWRNKIMILYCNREWHVAFGTTTYRMVCSLFRVSRSGLVRGSRKSASRSKIPKVVRSVHSDYFQNCICIFRHNALVSPTRVQNVPRSRAYVLVHKILTILATPEAFNPGLASIHDWRRFPTETQIIIIMYFKIIMILDIQLNNLELLYQLIRWLIFIKHFCRPDLPHPASSIRCLLRNLRSVDHY